MRVHHIGNLSPAKVKAARSQSNNIQPTYYAMSDQLNSRSLYDQCFGAVKDKVHNSYLLNDTFKDASPHFNYHKQLLMPL